MTSPPACRMLHSKAQPSIIVAGSYFCRNIHVSDLLTTDEAAAYLRLSERKLYELVADGAVPCSKATGRWLFPKAALDQWVTSSMAMRPVPPAPPIVGGSHGPLLDWAAREGGRGLH